MSVYHYYITTHSYRLRPYTELGSALSTALTAGLRSSPSRANGSSPLRTWLSYARLVAKKPPPNLQVVLRFHVWGLRAELEGHVSCGRSMTLTRPTPSSSQHPVSLLMWDIVMVTDGPTGWPTAGATVGGAATNTASVVANITSRALESKG